MKRGNLVDRLAQALPATGGKPESETAAAGDAAPAVAELAEPKAAHEKAERRGEHLRLRVEVLSAELDRAGRRNEALTARLRAQSRGEPAPDLEALRTRLGEVERERDDLAARLARAEEIKAMLTDLGPLTLDELDQRMAARLAAIENRLAALRARQDGPKAPDAA